MRAVADTNTIVSGLLWQGAPRQVLNAAREGKLELFASAILLAELEDVLSRAKFAARLELAQITVHDLVIGYAALSRLVAPVDIVPVIAADVEDDAVLACALAAQAEVIISGDRHLLTVQVYQNIPILTASDLLLRLSAKN